jgi:hypothetical protein
VRAQPSSLGNRAKNTGIICRAQAMACRRASACAACSEDGRIGMTVAMDSSSASDRAAMDRKARARRAGFSCAVARCASRNTLISTRLTSGAGMSDATEGAIVLNLSGNLMHSAMGSYGPLANSERRTPVIWQARQMIRGAQNGVRSEWVNDVAAAPCRMAELGGADVAGDYRNQGVSRLSRSAAGVESEHRYGGQVGLP